MAAALAAQGHRIGRTGAGELRHRQTFCLQANRTARNGGSHPDRNAQSVSIKDSVEAALATGQPVVSVDAKKELVGGCKNAGQARRP